MVWVWDECAHDGPTEHHVAAQGGDKRNMECSAASTLHAVRCCASSWVVIITILIIMTLIIMTAIITPSSIAVSATGNVRARARAIVFPPGRHALVVSHRPRTPLVFVGVGAPNGG
mmetsp:Transcript_27560/g.68113  ORF Transcript_27560/g.68113 Transcript_27560/m.68113 type:complete len:116 (-) Transcript_27560:238-585(-)